MTTPDGRPRPQYGEYATPEEQRAHIKELPPHLLEQHPTAEPGAYGEGSRGVPPAARPDHAWRAAPGVPRNAADGREQGARPQTSSRGVDRFATIALLALGLYSVLTTVATMTDLAGYLEQTMKAMGMGSYTATAATGIVAAVVSGVNIVVWIAAAWLSTVSLRAGRLTFWIPLAAGVAVTLITGVCYAVLLMGDPSFIEYLGRTT